MATTQTGTPYYTCPEVWKDEPYSFKGDVWSLGCVIYEMCMLKPPFRAQQLEGLYHKVTQGVYDKISFVYSSILNMFIARCLTVESKNRASVDELLDSHFFREYNGIIHKKKSLEMSGSMLETMVFPENLADINNIVPGPQY
jgi:NIMA (never in mitosis gene a)-related kinase